MNFINKQVRNKESFFNPCSEILLGGPGPVYSRTILSIRAGPVCSMRQGPFIRQANKSHDKPDPSTKGLSNATPPSCCWYNPPSCCCDTPR